MFYVGLVSHRSTCVFVFLEPRQLHSDNFLTSSPYESKARASRVTEVSREGRTYKEREQDAVGVHFFIVFKTAITLKLKLQIKLCSCPLGSMYCLKKCPDTISAEYARWLQHNYNIPIPANKCSIQNKHILRNKSNLPLGQCSVFLQGQYPNKIWSIPWTVAPSPLKECSVHFQISNPHFKGAVPLLEKSIFLHDICSIIDIGHPLQKCNMFETVSTTICSNNVWLS